jgi:hypothetical protein
LLGAQVRNTFLLTLPADIIVPKLSADIALLTKLTPCKIVTDFFYMPEKKEGINLFIKELVPLIVDDIIGLPQAASGIV